MPVVGQTYDSRAYADVRGWLVSATNDAQGFAGCWAAPTGQGSMVALALIRGSWEIWVSSIATSGFEGGTITVDGSVTDAQFGFFAESGAYAAITPPLVRAIAQGSRLQISINNDLSGSWSLSGSAAAITKVEECAARSGQIAAPATASGTAAGGVESDALRMGSGCPAAGAAASGSNGTPAQVVFVNMTDRAVTVYWLDFAGMPVEYAGLLPGESQAMDTWAEHRWLAKDFDGTCYGGVIAPAAGASVWEIR